MSGESTDFKFLCYQKYGHYCNKASQKNLIPIPFREFKEIFKIHKKAAIRYIINLQNKVT